MCSFRLTIIVEPFSQRLEQPITICCATLNLKVPPFQP